MTRTVLITGATGTLGSSIARHLAPLGWNMVLTARDAARCDPLVRELEAFRVGVHTVALDLLDNDSVESLAARVAEIGVSVTHVVSNARSLDALQLDGEGVGASIGNRRAGSGGDAAIVSFNGNKIITTSGGGMLVTKHKDWSDQARFLSTQARDPAPHFEHTTFGYNYRLSNICAAIGLGQMQVLDDRVARRREIFARYKSALSRPGISFMPEPEGQFSTNWLSAITIDPARTGTDREIIRLALLDHQIEARPLWKPMHMQPLYQGATYHGRGVDERLFADGLCLPSGSDMSNEQQDEVIGHILAVLDGTVRG